MQYFNFPVSFLILTFSIPLIFASEADFEKAKDIANKLQLHIDQVGTALKEIAAKVNPDVAAMVETVHLEDKETLNNLIQRIESKSIKADEAREVLFGIIQTKSKAALQKEVENLPEQEKDAIKKNIEKGLLEFVTLAAQIHQALGGK